MFRSLFTGTDFFAFFDQHATLIVAASQEFLDLVSTGNPGSSEKIHEIKHLEHEADQIIHNCLKALHKTFITPIDRDEIYQLVSRMDDIIDAITEASRCLSIYKITDATPTLKQLSQVLHQSVLKVAQIVNQLRDLKNADRILEACVEIHRLENEADELLSNALATLFEEETDVKKIIKWKEIYETLEGATDYCEDAADAVQAIILESV
jgi:predicted phosphate transport protein (TIGR00153 family)